MNSAKCKSQIRQMAIINDLKPKLLFFTHILHFAFFNLHSAFCTQLLKILWISSNYRRDMGIATYLRTRQTFTIPALAGFPSIKTSIALCMFPGLMN
jgi:hypothetical protein